MSGRLLDLPPLDLVRSFVAVGRCMSITLAAEELCVTQSAVSRQVRALEEFLGCPLFVRGHRSIAFTEEGQRFFRTADIGLEQLGDAVAALRPARGEHAVALTTTIGVMSLWILPRIGAFQAAHPDVELRLVTATRLVDLEREPIDLAIRYHADAEPPPSAVRLFGEELVPAAHPSLRIEELEERDQLGKQVLLEFDDPSHPELSWSRWLSARGLGPVKKLGPGRVLRFNQYDQVVHAALAGHGVALGRLALIEPLLRDGRLARATRSPPVPVAYGYWLLARTRPISRHAGVVRAWILAEAHQTRTRALGARKSGSEGATSKAEYQASKLRTVRVR
ncbi:LysR substrate-binding domain-containing protein [Pendulispora albinea]|uniref:LysR substrate-binding domain-containing protein n=1 Tax=Pendulispora albinea TaxID=2741071 RepID=A0ABZ2M9J5_9BACT